MLEKYTGPERRKNSLSEKNVEEISLRAISSELEKAGIDIKTAEGRKDLSANIRFAREQRLRCEKAASAAIPVIVGSVLSGAAYLVWKGFLQHIGLPGGTK